MCNVDRVQKIVTSAAQEAELTQWKRQTWQRLEKQLKQLGFIEGKWFDHTVEGNEPFWTLALWHWGLSWLTLWHIFLEIGWGVSILWAGRFCLAELTWGVAVLVIFCWIKLWLCELRFCARFYRVWSHTTTATNHDGHSNENVKN